MRHLGVHRVYLKKAIELDPEIARAYALLANFDVWDCYWAGGGSETLDRAWAELQTAIALDDGSSHKPSEPDQGRLIEHFVACTTARCAAALVGVNRKTAAYYCHRLREVIAYRLELVGRGGKPFQRRRNVGNVAMETKLFGIYRIRLP